MNASSPKSGKWGTVGLIVAVLCLLLGFRFFIGAVFTTKPSSNPPRRSTGTPARPNAVARGPVRPGVPVGSRRSGSALQPRSEVRLALIQGIQETLDKMRREPDPEEKRMVLQSLKTRLMVDASKSEASKAIIAFLQTGQDVPTGLPFRVGPGHFLAEAPTLRSALLDWLGQFDAAAAGDYSTQVFAAMTTAEDYAVALRDFARGHPNQKEELRGYFNQMLAHEPWANRPGPGYMEAFDVVPYLGDASFVSTLEPFLSPTARVEHQGAATVAIDRLAVANPAGTLAELMPGKALDDQPLLRASLMARADIRETAQREVVERYLLDPSLTPKELSKFVGLFPNDNQYRSYNLLTAESKESPLPKLAAKDAGTLDQVRVWQKDPRFAELLPKLQELENRLREQVASAVRAGFLPAEKK